MLPESDFSIFYMGKYVGWMKWLAKFFISMAMSAIGLNTNIVSLVKKGGKPIVLGFCCWTMISVVSIIDGTGPLSTDGASVKPKVKMQLFLT